MQIHAQKMNFSPDVSHEELAQCKTCVEVGMVILCRGATELTHKDYMESILKVQDKKKADLPYYTWVTSHHITPWSLDG